MLDKHGLDNWMYPNLLWNPSGPEIPGFPGLFFRADGIDGPGMLNETIYRVIVRLKSGPLWQYVGQYKRIGAPSLTKEEWQIQSVQVSNISHFGNLLLMFLQVKNIWAKQILKKGWGLVVRARITLRQVLGRRPTEYELNEALSDTQNQFQLTPEDVKQAYDRGDEARLATCIPLAYR